METMLFAQIVNAISSIRTGLREGIVLLKTSNSDSVEVFSKTAGELELVECTVRDAIGIRILKRETSSLHMALSVAHDAFLWLAAFATIEWYHTFDADKRAKFRAVAESCEGLLDLIDKTRALLPYDQVEKESLH